MQFTRILRGVTLTLATLTMWTPYGCAPSLSEADLLLPTPTPGAQADNTAKSPAARRRGVTTQVDWFFTGADGGVWHATFVANAAGNGTWSVEATFDPDGIGFHRCSEGCIDPCFWNLHGRAQANLVVNENVLTQIAASGCYLQGHCGHIDVTVFCTFTIGADGVAHLSSLYFE